MTDKDVQISTKTANSPAAESVAKRDWRAAFKKASAAKRRGESAPTPEKKEPARIDERDRIAAREMDPTAYLLSAGFTCKHSGGGRQISVRRGGDEVYRVTQREQGHWVACDHHEFGVGDNIALVQEIEGSGINFREAVYRLLGAPGMAPLQSVTAKPRPVFVMPGQTAVDQARGREYLKGRGIDLQTILEAESAKFIAYTDKAVLFVGRDQLGTIKAATRRAAMKDDPKQKSEIPGSDKQFPAILKGTGDTAYIVDGGVDALALHAMAKRRGQPTPTVYVTGGVGNKSWMDRESIKAQLRRYRQIIIAGENEKDSNTQERTDAHRDETKQRLEAITGNQVLIVTPAKGIGKDMADQNAVEITKERAAMAAQDDDGEGVRVC